ncbi:hypothetical protein CRENBAI_017938 [Crenichthys baileyi]|uniref:Peptidase A2 domain-containing protein n=1 Tax=Crenichthys baileyi TaxID=28760 RepID=A0AAV9SKM6_9TELE
MSKETKKFQSLHKLKRAHTQIQTAPASSPMVKMEKTSHASELSELTEKSCCSTCSIPCTTTTSPGIHRTSNPNGNCDMLQKRETRTHCQSMQSSATRSQSGGWEHTPSSSAFKRVEPVVTGVTMGEQPDPHPRDIKPTDGRENTPLVGPTNEGEVEINGMKCRALIDSGSQITSITHSYWCSHPILQKQRLQPSSIPIEGAAGQRDMSEFDSGNIKLWCGLK